MKRGTPDHPKTLRLMALLGCGRAQAVGHLELLWHFSGKYAPQGDIGRWSDAEIASACAMECEETKFIAALVEAGWLDADRACRLIVHDWPDHADEAVKKSLQRRGLTFLTASRPRRDMSRQCRDSKSGQHPDMSSTVRARLGKARKGSVSSSVSDARARDVEASGFEAFWDAFPLKAARAEALEVWGQLAPDSALQARILAAVEHQKADPELAREGFKYLPRAPKWLRRRRWEDEPRPVTTAKIGPALAASLPGLQAFAAGGAK